MSPQQVRQGRYCGRNEKSRRTLAVSLTFHPPNTACCAPCIAVGGGYAGGSSRPYRNIAGVIGLCPPTLRRNPPIDTTSRPFLLAHHVLAHHRLRQPTARIQMRTHD